MTKSFRYLLDTNSLSGLVRQPQETLANRIAQVGEATRCTSLIVAAALRFGAEKSGTDEWTDRVDLILFAIDILPLESPADRTYATPRHDLARNGTPIGPKTTC